VRRQGLQECDVVAHLREGTEHSAQPGREVGGGIGGRDQRLTNALDVFLQPYTGEPSTSVQAFFSGGWPSKPERQSQTEQRGPVKAAYLETEGEAARLKPEAKGAVDSK